GERGLARARETRDHGQPVARDLDVDALQVVLAGPANDDALAPCGDPAGAPGAAHGHAPRAPRASATAASTPRRSADSSPAVSASTRITRPGCRRRPAPSPPPRGP